MIYTEYQAIEDEIVNRLEARGVHIKGDIKKLPVVHYKLNKVLEESGTDWSAVSPIISLGEIAVGPMVDFVEAELRRLETEAGAPVIEPLADPNIVEPA